MASRVVVVIRDDPFKSGRPVEALRIALGLGAGDNEVTVVLLGESVKLLADTEDDVIDGVDGDRRLGVQVVERKAHDAPFAADRFETGGAEADAERRGERAGAQAALAGFEGTVIVLYGDTPFIRAETLEAMITARTQARRADAVSGTRCSTPSEYPKSWLSGGKG